MILKVNNTKYDFFDNIRVRLVYDSVGSIFSFDGLFDPDYEPHKKLFKPLSFQQVTVEHNDELLITGQILNNTFQQSKVQELTNITGYSLPGVLEDCEIPVSLYPLQSDKRTLKDIAERLIEPFGISMVIDDAVSGEMNKRYDVSTADEKQSVKSYLTELAGQRNIVLSHTPEGKLLFTKASTKQKPIALFEEGAPGLKMSLSTKGQKMYKTTTVQRQSSVKGLNAGEHSINNPFVEVYRTHVKTQSSGDDNDTEKAAKTLLAAQLKNISLTIEVDRWEWLNNEKKEIMRPGKIITVLSPKNYIYNETRFFVESVEFSGVKQEKTATLICVLPEVYSRETPKNIFL